MSNKNFPPMKKFNKSNNLVSRFTHKFFLTIVIPIIVLWGSYLFILNLHFINNTLSIQQTHLLNSLSTLKLSMANADYVFSSLENIPEITYYMDIYSLKSKMLYSLKKMCIRDSLRTVPVSGALPLIVPPSKGAP